MSLLYWFTWLLLLLNEHIRIPVLQESAIMDRLYPTLILIFGFAALFLFQTGFSFRCYKCNSYMQEDCADHFNNQTWHLSECAENVTMCRKIVQEVFYNDEWQLRYVRQCAPSGIVGGDEGRRCMEKTGTYKVKVRICHCDNQEGCNGASNFHSNIHVILLPLMTIVYVKYLWT
ncbi:UPAR/Ly6 domain-containing protein crok-like [Mytilus edulis]|uniref:UPAR/Ly6 domain-containing protein crok-like n=1 Tax=Mytilus edulis TaxID=6550 RepID=UPI0039F10FEA